MRVKAVSNQTWDIFETHCRKQTETGTFFKNYDPTVGLNHAPKTQQARSFPFEPAGNLVELLRSAHINCTKL